MQIYLYILNVRVFPSMSVYFLYNSTWYYIWNLASLLMDRIFEYIYWEYGILWREQSHSTVVDCLENVSIKCTVFVLIWIILRLLFIKHLCLCLYFSSFISMFTPQFCENDNFKINSRLRLCHVNVSSFDDRFIFFFLMLSKFYYWNK